jgi:hypothetical protein
MMLVLMTTKALKLVSTISVEAASLTVQFFFFAPRSNKNVEKLRHDYNSKHK